MKVQESRLAEPRVPALRVVYDGSPEAGKTSSLLAMAKAFEELVVVPEEENGRTVFFDWLEHRAVAPGGRSYRLQVVSVPGQTRWGARRAHLVSLAHVVVFVADTRREAWRETRERWQTLLEARAEGNEAVVPIVFQANKRDCADVVALPEIRSLVPSEIPIVESSASLGIGVEEAFWAAVRLASSRVSDTDEPAEGALDEPQALLERLVALDATTAQLSSQASALRAGFVWPPIEGRSILREALADRAELRVVDRGTYGLGSSWRIFSPRNGTFENIEESRTALIEWARLHARLGQALSSRRSIVVLETTDGRYRLWQLAHREPTFRELLADDVPFGGETTLAGRLVVAALGVRRVHALAAELGFELPCSLDTVGWGSHSPQLVGLMPYPLREPAPFDVDELGWQLETCLVLDSSGNVREALDSVIARRSDPEERAFLLAAFGVRA